MTSFQPVLMLGSPPIPTSPLHQSIADDFSVEPIKKFSIPRGPAIQKLEIVKKTEKASEDIRENAQFTFTDENLAIIGKLKRVALALFDLSELGILQRKVAMTVFVENLFLINRITQAQKTQYLSEVPISNRKQFERFLNNFDDKYSMRNDFKFKGNSTLSPHSQWALN